MFAGGKYRDGTVASRNWVGCEGDGDEAGIPLNDDEAALQRMTSLLDRRNFRCLPKLQVGPDGVPRYRGEADEVLAAGLNLGRAVAAAGRRRLGPAPVPPCPSTSATRGNGEAKDSQEKGDLKEEEGDGDSDMDAKGEGDETDDDEYEDEDEQHKDDVQVTERAGGKRKHVGREVVPDHGAGCSMLFHLVQCKMD
ncbi:hypothetical protein K438DRAFT_1838620, partial [Mycena galopus ATCC 62051]